MVLITRRDNGTVVSAGDEVTDHNGEKAVFRMATRPRHDNGITGGRVLVSYGNGDTEFYDKVFGLQVSREAETCQGK